MHSRSDKIEIIILEKGNEVSRDQIGLETSIKDIYFTNVIK